jgi:electron transfer flavoprotein beta subunit
MTGPTGSEVPNVNVIVLAKYVPNPNGTPEMGEDFLLVREGVEGAMDPTDEYGVEAGLRLVEAAGDGEVTLVSMGPEPALAGIRKGLSMGANRAVVVIDPALRGADALVTARVLAKTIARQPFDVVIAGAESTDGYTGTMPISLAQLLGVPSVTFARSLSVDGGTLKAERQTEAGYDEVEAPLPSLVTVTAGVGDPRYPTLKGIMGAKSKPVEQLSVGDLGLGAEDVTPEQRVTGATDAAEKQAGHVFEDDGTAAERIAAFLQEAKVF